MTWASRGISAGPCEQSVGVSCLRGPVTERGHVYVHESGGSSPSSPGSRGSGLTWRALGGIAFSLASFLTRRHHSKEPKE
jgi:hypothetical protein